MKDYFKHLNKIEFVVTYACTGSCKHCSEGEHSACGEHIDGEKAAEAVKAVCARYPIATVMTFGGEPLLYPEAVYAIQSAARDCGVVKRQVITNGYFTKDSAKIETVVEQLLRCGVNEILLSVDAFHQETIPISPVMQFAREVKKRKIPLKLSPAWLISRDDTNPYNQKTREILASFVKEGFEAGEGNIVFPEGNAAIYLKEYFGDQTPENPYLQNAFDVNCLSFDPDGSVLGGSISCADILTIMNEYIPEPNRRL